jgi:uncharacterized protein
VSATLLDGNVLVALAVADHVHHDAAIRWFGAGDGPFATSPITQGTLVRFLVRQGLDAADALATLDAICAHGRHVFWPDDRPYDAVALRGVIGHRQVTDGYLAASSRARRGRLATFDKGLAITHADVVVLLPDA